MDGRSCISVISVSCLLITSGLVGADDGASSRTMRVFQKACRHTWSFADTTHPSPLLLCEQSDGGLSRISLATEDPEGFPPAETDQEADSEDCGEEVEAEAAEELQSTLFGDEWHQAGPITAELLYTGEVFNNARGGLTTKGATRYRGDVALTLRLDTLNAGWWDGGEFLVYLQHDHGRTLTQQFVGDGQYYSSIDTGLDQDITQLGEYTYQHTFGEDLFSVKAGRQDANENFAFADLGGDFVNSSFITLANVPLPTWPYQTLGVSSLFQPASQLRLGGGVYDHGTDHGQWWMTAVNRGVFVIGQADYQPFAEDEDALLTLVRCGGWYTTSDTAAVDAGADFGSNHGFYATLDQMLWPESEDREQGLGAFLQYSWAPADRNQVDQSWGAGLVCRGLLRNRDTDTLGAGFTVIEFSPDLRDLNGQTSETAFELFYKARVRSWLTLQPDLQYIERPNGNGRDALVAGFRCEVAL